MGGIGSIVYTDKEEGECRVIVFSSPSSTSSFITAEGFRDLNSIAKVHKLRRYLLLYIFMFKMIRSTYPIQTWVKRPSPLRPF